MAVLWMGGEDVDFPTALNLQWQTSSAYFRSAYARGGLTLSSSTLAYSNPFSGGAVTSAWFAFRFGQDSSSNLMAGLGKTGIAGGLIIGVTSTGAVSINSHNGTTATTLATSGAGVFPGSQAGNMRMDVQVTNFGTSGTVTVYVNGAQALTYTGNITFNSATSLDCFVLASTGGAGGPVSEMLVADESTLPMQGVVTLAPNANGTTQQWSNPAYTNVNPTTINDGNSTYVDATGQDEQVGLPSTPSGSFAIKAVKTAVRAMATPGSASTNLQVGFRSSGGTVAVNPSHAVSNAFTTYEDLFTNDPTTSAAWSSLASYQLDLRSA